MAKNLVICCDGTSNEFGAVNTNVVRLIQVLQRDHRRQLIYYDPGVGTLPEPGLLFGLFKQVSRAIGLAFGLGLTRNVAEAYQFLMEHYVEGDRVYLFGFSRGAYTVRALAGVLHQFGLLPPGSGNLIPYLLRLSKAVNDLGEGDTEEKRHYWRLTKAFGNTFSRSGTPPYKFKIEYLGLWDTVSSVGWVWDPKRFPYTARNPSVRKVRHAVALDDRRAFFRQNLWRKDPKSRQDVEEQWFPGVHSDIGGGYPEEEGGLWRYPFVWILLEAWRSGLEIDRAKLRGLLKSTRPPCPGWASPAHESLTPRWWPAEFFPKLARGQGQKHRWPRLNFFRARFVPEGSLLAPVTVRRLQRVSSYRPSNLSTAFVEVLQRGPRTLKAVPYSPTG